MSKDGKYKIIIDTNLWVSFLIGRRLQDLTEVLGRPDIQIVFSSILMNEVLEVTGRDKFKKYFKPNAVMLLKHFMQKYAEFYQTGQIPKRCRDPKDDYLLELAVVSEADFLISGDSDLTDMKHIGNTEIVTFADFKNKLTTQK